MWLVSTGEKCVLNFKPCGMFGKELHRVEGYILDKRWDPDSLDLNEEIVALINISVVLDLYIHIAALHKRANVICYQFHYRNALFGISLDSFILWVWQSNKGGEGGYLDVVVLLIGQMRWPSLYCTFFCFVFLGWWHDWYDY